MRPASRVLPYEILFCMQSVPKGVYVFCDIDRLSLADLERAKSWFHILKDNGATVLNDPGRFTGRLSLNQILYEKGYNSFNVYPQHLASQAKLPVFLRSESEHEGPISDLIHDRSELGNQLKVANNKFPRRNIIIVEFLDSKEPDGRYYKYSHFRVANKLIFAGMVCGEPWCLKFAYYQGKDAIQREKDFAQSDRFNAEIMERFNMAGIEYGRMDYAIVNDRIEVFEINTNPDIGHYCQPELKRWSVREYSYHAFNGEFYNLITESADDSSIKVPGKLNTTAIVKTFTARPRSWLHFLREWYPYFIRTHFLLTIWRASTGNK